MPCYDPRPNYDHAENAHLRDESRQRELYVRQLESMLCAMCNEVINLDTTEKRKEEILDRATSNGKSLDIHAWFKLHLEADVKRLVVTGVNRDSSIHEILLYRRMEELKTK